MEIIHQFVMCANLNPGLIAGRRQQIRGFLVLDYADEFESAQKELAQAVKDKKLSIEGAETVVKTDFADVPKTFGMVRLLALVVGRANSETAIYWRQHWKIGHTTSRRIGVLTCSLLTIMIILLWTCSANVQLRLNK